MNTSFPVINALLVGAEVILLYGCWKTVQKLWMTWPLDPPHNSAFLPIIPLIQSLFLPLSCPSCFASLTCPIPQPVPGSPYIFQGNDPIATACLAPWADVQTNVGIWAAFPQCSEITIQKNKPPVQVIDGWEFRKPESDCSYFFAGPTAGGFFEFQAD